MRLKKSGWFWICFTLICVFPVPVGAEAEKFDLRSSTQFLWGDDWLGEEQSIVATYMRFNYKPGGEKVSFTGYGRVWKNFTDSEIRDDDLSGRLYYFYMDYSPFENFSLRMGRQFVNFTAGSALLDGVTLNVSKLGPFGVTFADGADVRLSLDGADSKLGNHFIGLNLRLLNVRATQMGISYVRRYSDRDITREGVGLNLRRSWARLSPYGELRYDWITETFDELVGGIDFFPVYSLMIKGEYYRSYPTFDSTSIYSVFAVDHYQEYLLRAEYSFKAPFTLFASFSREIFGNEDHANAFKTGSSIYPTNHLTLKVAIDHRTGYGGKAWGYEAEGDYKIKDRLVLSAGGQHDVYERPSQTTEQYATRYWIGGRWQVKTKTSITARFENNVNENFNYRPLGRVTLDQLL